MKLTARHLISHFLLLAALFNLAGCGGGSTTDGRSNPMQGKGAYRVALDANVDSRAGFIDLEFDPLNAESYNFKTSIEIHQFGNQNLELYFQRFSAESPNTWKVYFSIDKIVYADHFVNRFSDDGSPQTDGPNVMQLYADQTQLALDIEIDFSLLTQYSTWAQFYDPLENGPSFLPIIPRGAGVDG